MLKLGWMSTGRGETSLKLLRVVCEDIEAGRLDARISFVLSNREPGEAAQTDRFFDFARSRGLPLICESSSGLRQRAPGPDWRTRFDHLLSSRIEQFDVDLFFLAGYMLIVSDFLCTQYLMLNLHPALPDGPKGTWQEVMAELARTGAARTGAMVHIVTPELDRGPTTSYCSFSIEGEPFASLRGAGDTDALADAIREDERRREFPLILTTLRSLAAGDIVISERRAYNSGGRLLDGGRDLSAEVERLLAEPESEN